MRINLNHQDFLDYGAFLNCHNVLLCDDGVWLNTDKKGITFLNSKKIKFIREKTRFLEKYPICFFVGLSLFLIGVFINNYRISKIIFNDEYPINDDITYYLMDNLKHLGPFSFMNVSLNDVNLYLRQRYIGYEWISVNKKHNTLYVNITSSGVNDIKENTLKGNIVSRANAIIKSFSIYSGNHNLTINQMVNQGDYLVLGNNQAAKGLIIGEVIVLEEVRVRKITPSLEYTGNVDFYEEANLFGMNLFFHKDENFTNYEKVEKPYFNLPFFSYKKIITYEKCDIITIYSKEDAKEYAISKIKNDFETLKMYDEEKIIDIIFYQEKEDENYYTFQYLVKKDINIGTFIKE